MASEATRLLGAARAAARGAAVAASTDTFVNGSLEHRLPGNLNISFAFVEGEALLMALKDVAVSSGSACTSASLEPSYVLRALGVGEELAHTSIRFGLGRFNTEEEVDYVIDLVVDKVKKLREMSPLYEMHKEGIDLKTIAVGRPLSIASDTERTDSHGVQRKSHRPLREPAQRRAASTRTTRASAPASSARRRAAT